MALHQCWITGLNFTWVDPALGSSILVTAYFGYRWGSIPDPTAAPWGRLKGCKEAADSPALPCGDPGVPQQEGKWPECFATDMESLQRRPFLEDEL